MTAVPPHVLKWLSDVLRALYQNVDRTYQDVARVLESYPNLKPRTESHTFNNGQSALLLLLDGVIPVMFRGHQYNFPVNIWVPHSYPREPPTIYVVPTQGMLINPGQHVDPGGQVYHPYLSNWYTVWDKSSVFDLLAILRDVFAKEPPVKSRAAQPTPQQATPQPAPPPVPPLPPDLTPRPASQAQSPHPGPSQQSPPAPPPPPPKGNGQPPVPQQAKAPANPARTPPVGPAVPPVPPKPPTQPDSRGPPPVSGYGPPYQQHAQPPPTSHYGPHQPQGTPQPPPQPSRYDTAPPLPPQAQAQIHPGRQYAHGPPPPPQGGYQPGQPQGVSPPSSVATQYGSPDPRHASIMSPPQGHSGGPPPGWQPVPHSQAQPAPPPQQPKPKAPPPPDIMDADDMQLAFEEQTNVEPPPIPPNPEKDMLLHQLAQTLHSMRMSSKQTTESRLTSLDAQRKAMTDARLNILSEMQNLTLLSQMLQSNASILHDTMRQADQVIQNSKTHPAPDVDSLLIAPSVVATQLYNLVAEERALGDTVFMMGRAVERGKIDARTFARTTRGLARDWFLKKALIRKVGRGMGLSS